VVSTRRAGEVEAFVASLLSWARLHDDVRAVALVGSWARGQPRADSDVDVVLLSEAPDRYVESEDWLGSLGGTRLIKTQQVTISLVCGQHAGPLMARTNTAMYIGILITSAVGGTILASFGFNILIELAAAIALLGVLTTRTAIPLQQQNRRQRPSGRRSSSARPTASP
jgi:Nucleotidyltransferase domain